MTVGQLIRLLEKLPQQAEVINQATKKQAQMVSILRHVNGYSVWVGISPELASGIATEKVSIW